MFIIVNFWGSLYNNMVYDSKENAAIAICNNIIQKLMEKTLYNIILSKHILRFNKLLQNKQYIEAASMSHVLISKTLEIKEVNFSYPKKQEFSNEFINYINNVIKQELFK